MRRNIFVVTEKSKKMTIYKPKNGVDRKPGNKLEKSPAMVMVGDDAMVG